MLFTIASTSALGSGGLHFNLFAASSAERMSTSSSPRACMEQAYLMSVSFREPPFISLGSSNRLPVRSGWMERMKASTLPSASATS